MWNCISLRTFQHKNQAAECDQDQFGPRPHPDCLSEGVAPPAAGAEQGPARSISSHRQDSGEIGPGACKLIDNRSTVKSNKSDTWPANTILHFHIGPLLNLCGPFLLYFAFCQLFHQSRGARPPGEDHICFFSAPFAPPIAQVGIFLFVPRGNCCGFTSGDIGKKV